MTTSLDNLDIRILDELQDDVTAAAADIADRVGSSKSVVWRRIQDFIANGVIERRVAILNPQKVGCNVVVFAMVKMSRHNANALPKFIEAVKAIPQVLECHTVLGQVDFLLKIVTGSIEEYREVVWTKLSQLEVQEISSMISFERTVDRTKLPLRHIGA
ncbi:Lrp/AsnC family transcriptional regulator [Stenotrophobium rhamnosiphilum]|uniref:AsnC family transcriptional regulator n=1 Tax=Stenotrophobium rhamnosiphilum TaxID=2029166 RepID=A0A2T5ME51_9GAMM|nr:Lrp/AsnC family transcriptional regulator [Stenotrophobium rhamnosiphilum]PTU30861.1 AsnC family transcriptional regulator [Stenotrophobium rhamnosiphilum]